jgi:hypothetical protein
MSRKSKENLKVWRVGEIFYTMLGVKKPTNSVGKILKLVPKNKMIWFAWCVKTLLMEGVELEEVAEVLNVTEKGLRILIRKYGSQCEVCED